jgi:hypothetical protein
MAAFNAMIYVQNVMDHLYLTVLDVTNIVI